MQQREQQMRQKLAQAREAQARAMQRFAQARARLSLADEHLHAARERLQAQKVAPEEIARATSLEVDTSAAQDTNETDTTARIPVIRQRSEEPA